MDCEASTRNLLEGMLHDENAKPTDLPLTLLKEITKDFSVDLQIGSGGFSVVYKGLLGNGRSVAVKKLSGSINMDENKYNQEVACLMRVKHTNIVRFLGYCADTQGKMCDYGGKFVMADVRQRLLCFEYLPKGSLEHYISNASVGLGWRKCYQIIKGICEGLCYLHGKRIVHRDLKPANILLDNDMVPKIADFGLSRCFEENQSKTITTKLVGSMGYLAPEFFGGVVTPNLDIYSLGVIITELLTGNKGYTAVECVLESWRNTLNQSWAKIQLKQIRVCTDISIECTDRNPAKRPAIQNIIELLNATEKMDEFTEYDTSNMSITAKQKSSKPPVSQPEPELSPPAIDLPELPLDDLKKKTDNFGSSALIGEGSCGRVYHAMLDDERQAAVKKLDTSENELNDELLKQVSLAPKLKHENLVEMQVATGRYHTFLIYDSSVYSCGSSFCGVLGHGPDITQCVTFSRVSFPSLSRVINISASHNHAAFVTECGEVLTCGDNSSLCCGHGEVGRAIFRPAQVEALKGVSCKQVATGLSFTVILTTDGQVYTCGSNTHGQLGHGDTIDRATPKIIELFEGPTKVVQIAAGASYTFAVTDDGAVHSFGSCTNFCLGHGDQHDEVRPRAIQSFKRRGIHVVRVSAGDEHAVAIDALGHVYTWGRGYCGALGHGDENDKTSPELISSLKNQVAVQVCARKRKTFVLTNEGSVYAFGWMGFGSLGFADRTSSDRVMKPRVLESLRDHYVSQISTGLYHTVAVTNKGIVFGFGDNERAQLGHECIHGCLKPTAIMFQKSMEDSDCGS